ncbi:NAD(P)-dependent dehydrogenase (short-subunit alcohol dehydrogenase family) [Paraburkholderia caballeronis]|uniref:SDR family NAD(P)-dependent oxidoreductase n=1 Tax=Paraburkholderia caballeronis TaxID=416943 RepID=UPI001066A524|nr:SDR family NAD(P)-dependent oxidoreductase [Paraburkholderia caballeronis]TDV35606.1 NAD(P)-dependent dehydrogenase (short-subunit alcohol dehydrogenase family) [Paraburkholderia caballeronis]
MLLDGKVAIVTGCASRRGIGWATARLFAQHGARVAMLDLNEDDARSAAAAIGDAHQGYACDVRDARRCEQVVAQIVETFGAVDILVNNAGVSQPNRLMDSTMDDYDLVLDVSLRGTFNMSRAITPHFRARRGGAIVCMGSLAAQRGGGVLGGPHYAAAKGAVQALAKAMARELAPDGIRANAIAPGLIDTELLIGKITDDGKAAVAASTPLGRLGTAQDVANVCLFLASDLSAYVTGVVLDVNGGYHIH